jgi:methionyl-tRNA formyltransferase
MVIGVLTSGNLGLETLIQMESKFEIGFVLTDSNSNKIIEFCNLRKIPIYKGNPRDGKAYNFIKKIEVDIIASINYLFLIKKDIIQHSKKLTFNIHGSLLPKYRGRTPHVWAIINNEKETGITAHKIDEGCDTGDILSQIVVPIDEFDTGNSILEKYKREYFNLVKDVIDNCENNNLEFKVQNEKIATYFGNRTPEDGGINWNWQKERIQNWVRAQAHPYPGAFSFFDSNKIIIDKVEFSPIGYTDEMENGMVLANSPNIVVKTPNGALELTKLRTSIVLKIGDKIKG